MTFDVYAGTDWEFTLASVVDQAGSVVDVTGGTATALLKTTREDADADAIAELDVDLSGGDDWAVKMTLAKADSLSVAAGDYWIGLRIAVGEFEDIVSEFTVRVTTPIVREM